MAIATRTRLSTSYIQAAYLFARKSKKLEDKLKGNPNIRIVGIENTDSEFIIHRSYVLGAIFNCVSFLEAIINELFKDIADNDLHHSNTYFRNINKDAVLALAAKWNEKNFDIGTRTLEKYQVFLELSNSEPFDKGADPYQTAYLLINLRHQLIHFKPELVYHSEEHKFEKKLKGRFEENQLSLEEPFFPDRCLGQGCANWAVKSSLALTDKFYKRINVENPYDYYLKFVTDVFTGDSH